MRGWHPGESAAAPRYPELLFAFLDKIDLRYLQPCGDEFLKSFFRFLQVRDRELGPKQHHVAWENIPRSRAGELSCLHPHGMLSVDAVLLPCVRPQTGTDGAASGRETQFEMSCRRRWQISIRPSGRSQRIIRCERKALVPRIRGTGNYRGRNRCCESSAATKEIIVQRSTAPI